MNEIISRFSSLADMQAVHDDLLDCREGLPEGDEAAASFWQEVAAFVRRGVATGAILDASRDRRAGLSILDYWASALYRAGQSALEARLADFDPSLAPELPDEPCPYRGLVAFGEADRDFFFGREGLLTDMLERLRDGERLLAVVGSSGSGKSSVVLAGLLPRLKGDALPGSEGWRYATLVPGSQPLTSLARTLQSAAAAAATSTELDVAQAARLLFAADGFRRDPDYLAATLDETAATPLVLVVDQFEELFTLCADEDERAAFVRQLLGLANDADSPHRVILTMRTDFVDNVAKLSGLFPLFRAGRVDVEALDINELRAAIEGPAARVGLKFEEGIVDDLISTILGERAGLPLLQFTLLRLWEKRQRNRVTREIYREVGNPREALERSAEAFYKRLIPEAQETAKRILLRMVQPGEGREVTSNRIRRDEVFRGGEARDRVEHVLDRLIGETRLVKLTEGETAADAQIEVAHEALVRNWPRLVGWLDEEREVLRRRQRLMVAAAHWERLNKNADALWRGALLEEAGAYHDLTGLEQEFIAASKDQAEDERRAETGRQVALAEAQAEARAAAKLRRRNRILAGALLVSVVATIVAGYFYGQANIAGGRERNARQTAEAAATAEAAQRARAEGEALARGTEVAVRGTTEAIAITRQAQAQAAATAEAKQRQIADENAQVAQMAKARAEKEARRARAAELAVSAQLELAKPVYDPSLALLLASEAVNVTLRSDDYVNANADAALQVAVDQARVLGWRRNLQGHTGPVYSVAFSPDGTQIVTASGDNTARLWDAANGQELRRFQGHTSYVSSAAFSPSGKQIVTASYDDTARLWDVTSGQVLRQFQGHVSYVTSVAISSDGKQIVTASGDRTARLWDVTSGRALRQFMGHTSYITSVAFSPDGKQIVTASGDRTARLWDIASGQALRQLQGHMGPVVAAAFSPDGRQIVTASGDGTARLWDAATGKEMRQFQGHTDIVCSAAFSPDGKQIVTASYDRTARLWAATSGQELRRLQGHTGSVRSVAFSPDGQQIITASGDGIIRLWDAATQQAPRQFRGHTNAVRSAAFSPDGKQIVTASYDGTARLWDVASGQALRQLQGHTNWVYSAALSPDGKQIVTAGYDNTARLWDTVSGQALRQLQGHTNYVTSAVFSPDGKQIVTTSHDGTARLWDAVSGQTLRQFQGHTDSVSSAIFSSDGKQIVTASADSTARLWDAASGQALRQFQGHTGPVISVAYSPDGQQIITASADGTAWLWDAASGQALRQFQGHTGPVTSVAYSPNGKQIVTASGDGTARLWDAASGRALRQLQGHAGPVTSVAFSPDGKQIVTASDDGTARLWVADIRDLLAQAASLIQRDLPVFTKDERQRFGLGE